MLALLKGQEEIIEEPDEETYYVTAEDRAQRAPVAKAGRKSLLSERVNTGFFVTPIKTHAQKKPTEADNLVEFPEPLKAEDTSSEDDDRRIAMFKQEAGELWKIDFMKYEHNSEKVRRLNRLLDEWVDDLVKLDLDNSGCENAVESYAYILETYKVVPEIAAADLLKRAQSLKLGDSMLGYITKHKEWEAGLARVGYLYNNHAFVRNILNGLPPKYEGFKEMWDLYYHRSRYRSKPIDLPDFCEKLLK